MSGFLCPSCGGSHDAVPLHDNRRVTHGGRGLENLPIMTIGEWFAAHPAATVEIGTNRIPVAFLFHDVQDDHRITARVYDERLHPDAYPRQLPDGRWVTVGGLFDPTAAALKHELEEIETPISRFLRARPSSIGHDRTVLDALVRLADPASADLLASQLDAHDEQEKRLNARLATILAAERAGDLSSVEAEAQRVEARMEVKPVPLPFPSLDGETFRFSDGSTRTIAEIVDAENASQRAMRGI